MVPQPTEPRYLRTAQVAELLHVSPKTVSRWAQEGRLPYLRTLGGHRRYPDAEIRALLVAGYLGERLVRQRLRPSGWDRLESPLLIMSIALAAAMASLGLGGSRRVPTS